MKRQIFSIAIFFISSIAFSQERWTEPVTLVESHGRLAIGNSLHIVGHIGKNLVHRYSRDNGATWTSPTIIGKASENYPMQYGGLFAQGNMVYLITAAGDMGGREQHVDFRKSSDNGLTWSKPIRITSDETLLRRARIVAYKNNIHIAGLGAAEKGFVAYFRSTDGGISWQKGQLLVEDLGKYGGGQTIAVDKNSLHLAYTKVRTGVGGGDTYYIRSSDNGRSWSSAILIGENSRESDRQARAQVMAKNNKVLVFWQREADSTGLPIPLDRLGYNRSVDNGRTWSGVKILPDDHGTNREHQHIWMSETEKVHICWYTGENFVGYKYSPDFGRTWMSSEIAIKGNQATVPYSIVADKHWVHILSGPMGGFLYSRKRLKK